MLSNLLKELSKVDIHNSEYNGFDKFAEYHTHLSNLYREFAIELEYNLAPIQGSEAKVQYIKGLQQALNVSITFAKPKLVSILRHLTSPSEQTTKNTKRRIPINIGDDMPTYLYLNEIEEIIYKNESNGYWDMDFDGYMLLTSIQIHVYHIEAVDFLLKNRIRQIEQGEKYVPLINPATISPISKVDITERYPLGIMTRAEVIEYLNINASTMTRYTNEGKISPINPNAKSHTYTTDAVLRLLSVVGRGTSKKKK